MITPQFSSSDGREAAFQARYDYLYLPAQIPAIPNDLERIYEQLQPEVNEQNLTICLTAGSVALELSSVYAPFRPKLADEWNQQAQSDLETVVQNHPSQVKRLEGKLLLDTVPLFSPRPTDDDEARRIKAADTGAQIFGLYASSANPEHSKEIRGLMHKHSVLLALSGLASQGLIAYPSFLREKSSRRPVNGTQYRWDVTVESAGKLLPAGKFPLRVTAKDRHERLHPHIVPISANNVAKNLRLPTTVEAFEATLRTAGGQFTDEDAVITERLQTSLIRHIAVTGLHRTDTPALSLRTIKNKYMKS